MKFQTSTPLLTNHKTADQCTEFRFARFLSGGFTNMVVINPPGSRLAKRTSVQCRWLKFCSTGVRLYVGTTEGRL